MSAELDSIANPRLTGALLSADPELVMSALPEANLLVPASVHGDGSTTLAPLRGPGNRRLLVAFTDSEALRAWDLHPADAAVTMAGGALARLVAPGSGTVLLNPAGPGAHLVGGEAPENRRRRSAELVAPDARRELRSRARDAYARGREALSAGALAPATAELTASLVACDELEDRLHGAAVGAALARCHLHAGAQDTALTLFARAGQAFGLLGELDEAADTLLEGAEAALSNGRPEEAEHLTVVVLDLLAGSAVSDRLLAVWSRLTATSDPESS